MRFGMARSFVIVAVLLFLTIAVFSPLNEYDFVNYDDNDYVTKNPVVRAGLTARGVRWAFTSVGYASNWHPLTWLSHMLDVSLFGMSPGRHHLMSLLYHLATTVLLFSVLRRITGAAWPSAFTAALFAIHPLHVESVAWISDRKGLLCGFFWVLTIGAYGSYVRRRTLPRYAAVALFCSLSLLAKPFAVTIPIVLLLLDFWPLGRLRAATTLKLLAEKIPLLALSFASGLVTILAQRKGGSITNLDLLVRVDNAILSYVRYLGKTVWPADLAIIYPHPGVRLPLWDLAGAALILLGVSVLALRCRRNHPEVTVGCLWFAITLIPVIGLLHVGSTAMADRYSYLSLIGPFMGVSWETRRVVARWCRGKLLVFAGVALLLVSLAVVTQRQVRYWKDSVSLFRHAIEVTEDNYMAHFSLGMAYVELHDYEQALFHVTTALSISPSFDEARTNRDILLYITRPRPGGNSPGAGSSPAK